MGRTAQAGRLTFEPNPGPQTALLACPIYEVFFGGARGGGKTFGMLLDFLEHATTYGASANGVFFRRTAKQLEEVIREATAMFPSFGGRWLKQDATWVFESGPAKGARLKMRHLWDAADASNYLGHAYTWICFEEITTWPTPEPIDMLRGTLRSAAGVPVKFRATGNPGGAGHNWVKARYITPAPGGYTPIKDPRTGMEYVFIPSRLEDNPALTRNDPTYEARLRAAGSPALVKAWRYGEWDIVAGGFFDHVFRFDRHVIPSVAREQIGAESGWRFRRSFDWGHASPSSLGLWAIAAEDKRIADRHIPRGSAIRLDEWYTVAKDESGNIKANEGMRLSNESLGSGIGRRSANRIWSGCVADPSIFKGAGGPSIYDQMVKGAKDAGFADLNFGEADNTRIPGWQHMLEMLEEAGKDRSERPGIWVLDDCEHWLRTVPILQRDAKHQDDVDTEQEDHAADETRYLIQSIGRGEARIVKLTGH